MGWGLGRPLIHWKCYDFQASAWLRRWGGRQCSPSSHPILCRTKNTGVPRVCRDVSVRAISMLINTTIVTELTEYWKFSGFPKGSWTFRGFSSRCHRISCNFVDPPWFPMFSWIFFEFPQVFIDVPYIFISFLWIFIISTHFRRFSLICHCFLRLSVDFHRLSSISHGISLSSNNIIFLLFYF